VGTLPYFWKRSFSCSEKLCRAKRGQVSEERGQLLISSPLVCDRERLGEGRPTLMSTLGRLGSIVASA
jgi:hypothetical protein